MKIVVGKDYPVMPQGRFKIVALRVLDYDPSALAQVMYCPVYADGHTGKTQTACEQYFIDRAARFLKRKSKR